MSHPRTGHAEPGPTSTRRARSRPVRAADPVDGCGRSGGSRRAWPRESPRDRSGAPARPRRGATRAPRWRRRRAGGRSSERQLDRERIHERTNSRALAAAVQRRQCAPGSESCGQIEDPVAREQEGPLVEGLGDLDSVGCSPSHSTMSPGLSASWRSPSRTSSTPLQTNWNPRTFSCAASARAAITWLSAGRGRVMRRSRPASGPRSPAGSRPPGSCTRACGGSVRPRRPDGWREDLRPRQAPHRVRPRGHHRSSGGCAGFDSNAGAGASAISSPAVSLQCRLRSAVVPSSEGGERGLPVRRRTPRRRPARPGRRASRGWRPRPRARPSRIASPAARASCRSGARDRAARRRWRRARAAGTARCAAPWPIVPAQLVVDVDRRAQGTTNRSSSPFRRRRPPGAPPGVGDLGELLDHAVELGGAQPHAAAVERGVGAAGDARSCRAAVN